MIRYVLQRVARDARLLLVHKRRIQTKIVEKKGDSKDWNKSRPLWRVGPLARRQIFSDTYNGTPKLPPIEENHLRRLFYNNPNPFFAIVGVCLASGAMTITTKEDEMESICWNLRETVSRMRHSREEVPELGERLSLDDLLIGPYIAKGCSAVVYGAAWKKLPEGMSSGVSQLKDIDDYPLALKMMFNYDIQSNAMMIHRAMRRETLPARNLDQELASGPLRNFNLPPHPNIVTMYNAFCDQVPDLSGANQHYPSALPQRLNEDGYGRNMSLFLVMKRYNSTLESFLKSSDLNAVPRLQLLLFVQLLEALAFLHRYGVAHRDLKSDNILIEKHADNPIPLLVLNDFGCCLADRLNGLQVPYTSEDMDKGGNAALMAPEIISKQPGRNVVLDYSKSDLWAAGTIAYEIFGEKNPFSSTKKERSQLSNIDYQDHQLPLMGDKCPVVVRRLIATMLKRNPRKRLSPETTANVMQLFLWAPSIWLNPTQKTPSSEEIMDWLFCLTAKVLCENIFSSSSDSKNSNESYTEYMIISSFLQRASLSGIKRALRWIREVNREENSYAFA